MPFWHWDQVRHNRWARTLNACNQVGVRPIWPVDEEQEGQRGLSWAAATRPLRSLKKRIVDVGGKREFPQEKARRLEDAAQWELLFRGEEALWRSAAALRAAGYGSVLSLTREPIHDSSSTLDANNRVPLLTREPESRGAKHIRVLIPRGIKGVTEGDRVAIQAWLELADWTGKDVSLYTTGQRRERLSNHPSGLIKQWLVEEESRQGLLRENEPAKLFEECQRKLDSLANLLNTDPALDV
jgi:hypothetical protein